MWAEESAGKSHFETNAGRWGVPEAGEVLQSPNADGGRRSRAAIGQGCLACQH